MELRAGDFYQMDNPPLRLIIVAFQDPPSDTYAEVDLRVWYEYPDGTLDRDHPMAAGYNKRAWYGFQVMEMLSRKEWKRRGNVQDIP